MKALTRYLLIQLKIDLRDRGTLLNYYFVPLIFFFVMGAVFSSVNPLIKSTLAASITIFAITMGAVMGSPSPLVRMRESGTLRALKVNGIPGWAVIFTHALSAFIHLLIVSAIIYLCSVYFFGAEMPEAIGLYFIVLIVFLFTSIGIGLLIGSISRSQSFAVMFSMLIFLPTVLLSGIMFPTEMLPKALALLGRILPATYALQAFYGLAYALETNINALNSLVVILIIGVIIYFLAITRFNSINKSE